MNSSLRFLVAARRCEIEELEQLGRTGTLVGVIGELVHALQKERGLGNGYLGSGGKRFAGERAAQLVAGDEALRAVHNALDALSLNAQRLHNGARLFSRVADTLARLGTLPHLRERVRAQALSPAENTAAYARLVAGLLAVVFEAADGATDPGISRWLVAMFNFMQGKELAGQERAFGAAAFARGRSGDAQRQQWLHLIASQERCFDVFLEFSLGDLHRAWARLQADAVTAELERLRRIGCATAEGATFDAELAAEWFDCCTRRIDAMKTIEDELTQGLRALCATRAEEARAELARDTALLARLEAAHGPAETQEATPLADTGRLAAATTLAHAGQTDPLPSTPASSQYGRHLERSVMEMVQEQSRRLQAMSDELATVRASLDERKLVERAKGLLMAHRRLSEEEAHKLMRQTAMNQNRRLVEVAESVLAMADLLPAPAASVAAGR